MFFRPLATAFAVTSKPPGRGKGQEAQDESARGEKGNGFIFLGQDFKANTPMFATKGTRILL